MNARRVGVPAALPSRPAIPPELELIAENELTETPPTHREAFPNPPVRATAAACTGPKWMQSNSKKVNDDRNCNPSGSRKARTGPRSPHAHFFGPAAQVSLTLIGMIFGIGLVGIALEDRQNGLHARFACRADPPIGQ